MIAKSKNIVEIEKQREEILREHPTIYGWIAHKQKVKYYVDTLKNSKNYDEKTFKYLNEKLKQAENEAKKFRKKHPTVDLWEELEEKVV